jgi:hypothetical protein
VGKTLNKLIACILVAALALPAAACSSGVKAVAKGGKAVGELWHERYEEESEAEKKYRNAPSGWQKEEASKKYEASKEYSDFDFWFDVAAFTIVATMTLIDEAQKAHADNAQKQRPREKADTDDKKTNAANDPRQRPREKAKTDNAQKQRPGGLAGRGQSREDARPDFSRGYIPPSR